jgi:uncharacterized membrane protein
VKYEKVVLTTADLHQAWAALTDVESWPRWMDSYTSARRLDDGPLAVGSRARLKQPGLRAGTWRVTELVPDSSFSWDNHAPGVRSVARHSVDVDPHRTQIRLELEQTGILSRVVGVLLGSRIRRYLDIEARGLTTAGESRPA